MRNKLGQFVKGSVPVNKNKKGYGWIYKKCLNCKTTFESYTCKSRPNRGLFCCRLCRTYYQKGKRVLPEGFIFSPESNLKRSKSLLGRKVNKKTREMISRKNRGIGNGMYGKTHSDEYKKRLSAKRGSLSPNWKGGVTKENKLIRNCVPYAKWRKKIFERDNYTCQICGEVGGRLRANHIKRFCDAPKLRLNIDNGITICTNCDYGFIFNREKEWESYFYSKLHIDKTETIL